MVVEVAAQGVQVQVAVQAMVREGLGGRMWWRSLLGLLGLLQALAEILGGTRECESTAGWHVL